jgi:hypothetical protein
MREFVKAAEEYLQTPRAQRRLWPHLKAEQRADMVDTLLRNPNEETTDARTALARRRAHRHHPGRHRLADPARPAHAVPPHHRQGRIDLHGALVAVQPVPRRERRRRYRTGWRAKLPSVRIHHIRRADSDRHLHDHPWNARTIVLRGTKRSGPPAIATGRARCTGAAAATPAALFRQFHRISYVPPEGVWTLFITWPKKGTWGFLVDGVKVPWRKYLGIGGAS